MNSLAYTPKARGGTEGAKAATPVTIVSESEANQKPSFPTLNLNGEQASKAGLTKCAHGDEYEITVRIKATRIGGWGYVSPGDSGDEQGPSMEFDVISAGKPKAVQIESEEEESEEDAASEGESDDESKEFEKPKGKIEMSPKEAGFSKK